MILILYAHKLRKSVQAALSYRRKTRGHFWDTWYMVYWYNLLYCNKHFDNWRAPWKNWTSLYVSFFLPITHWCSISNVLFTGVRF